MGRGAFSRAPSQWSGPLASGAPEALGSRPDHVGWSGRPDAPGATGEPCRGSACPWETAQRRRRCGTRPATAGHRGDLIDGVAYRRRTGARRLVAVEWPAPARGNGEIEPGARAAPAAPGDGTTLKFELPSARLSATAPLEVPPSRLLRRLTARERGSGTDPKRNINHLRRLPPERAFGQASSAASSCDDESRH